MSSRCDYKRSKIGQHRQRARHQGLLVLTLILIGLFGGLLAYIRGDRTPAPATAAAPPPSAAPIAPAAPVAPVASTSPAAPAAPNLPTTPAIVAPPAAVPMAEPEPVKPKYDFYTELPKRQIDVQSGVAPPGASPSRPPVRTQPAVNQLQKPVPPRKNATPATLATASKDKAAKAKPVSAKTAAAQPVSKDKTAKAKPVTARTPAAEPASNGKTAKARPVSAGTAAAEPASNGKTAKAKPVTAATAAAEPARSKTVSASSATKSPMPRPLANSGSKIAVKTE